MPRLIYFYLQSLAVGALVTALLGCNSAGLQGGGTRKSGDEKSKQSKSEREETTATEFGTDQPVHDEEDDVADQPVPVSGAMLTCASVGVPGAETEYDLFGCVIERNKVKLGRDDFSASYSVATLPDRLPVSGAIVEPADEISLWHVFIKVPAGTASTYEVSAVIRLQNGGQQTPETLKVQVSKTGKLQALRFGMTREFHLGNNDYSGSACKPRLNTVALFGPLLSIRFKVGADETRTAFHITGICGLDYDDVAHIRVRRAGAVIKTIKIKKSQQDVVFGFDALSAGDYILELESIEMTDKRSKDRDDFIIGDITIISNKPLTGELPVP